MGTLFANNVLQILATNIVPISDLNFQTYPHFFS